MTSGVHKQLYGFAFASSSSVPFLDIFQFPRALLFSPLARNLGLSHSAAHLLGLWPHLEPSDKSVELEKRLTAICPPSPDHSFSDWRGKVSSLDFSLLWIAAAAVTGQLEGRDKREWKKMKKMGNIAPPRVSSWLFFENTDDFKAALNKGGYRWRKNGQLTTSSKVLWILVVFSNLPATIDFSRVSNTCSTRIPSGFIIAFDWRDRVCLLHLTQNENL